MHKKAIPWHSVNDKEFVLIYKVLLGPLAIVYPQIYCFYF